MNNTALMEKYCDELVKVEQLEEDVMGKMMTENPEKSIEMLRLMSSVLMKMCGNMNKVGEVITALTFLKEGQYPDWEIKHIKGEYGADIKIINKETKEVIKVEDKTSVTKASSNYAANWNFKVNTKSIKDFISGDVMEEWEEIQFIEETGSTMSDGLVTLNAYPENIKESPNRYVLDGNFMSLLLSRMAWNSAKDGILSYSINLGGKRCRKCKEYHRIMHLLEKNEEFLGRWKKLKKEKKKSGESLVLMWNIFSPDEWTHIMNTSLYKCPIY